MQRREWAPPVVVIADQLIENYRSAREKHHDVSLADLDALSTITSWQATARDHGEGFTEDDWIALVKELAWRVVADRAD